MGKRSLARDDGADDSSQLSIGNAVAPRGQVKHLARLEAVITDATSFHALLGALRACDTSLFSQC